MFAVIDLVLVNSHLNSVWPVAFVFDDCYIWRFEIITKLERVEGTVVNMHPTSYINLED